MKKIWTHAYRPMKIGDVRQPISTEIEPIEERMVKKIPLFSFTTSKGGLRIAEGVTGGIVGDDFYNVELSLNTADPAEVKQQLKDAEKWAKQAELLSNEEFFSIYKY